MSNLVSKLFARSALRGAVLGVTFAASLTAQAAVADAPAAPSIVPDSAHQTLDTVAGLAAVPLTASEAETFEAARVRWPSHFEHLLPVQHLRMAPCLRLPMPPRLSSDGPSICI